MKWILVPGILYAILFMISMYYFGHTANNFIEWLSLKTGLKTWLDKMNSWTYGLYNVYGRENAYFIQFKIDPNNPSKTIAQQTSLFRFVPSVTWNFKF